MNPWMIAEAAMNLVAMKWERDAIISHIKARDEAGATPEQIRDETRAMRDAYIAKAQADINAS